MQLKDKVAIITGASSGIGRAAALLFAKEGAKVVLGARRQGLLDRLVEEIRDDRGTATALAGDVKEAEYARRLVELAERMFGGLDAGFNNAGILGDLGPIADMAPETWHDVVATNLTSAFYASKYQIPAMLRRGGGSGHRDLRLGHHRAPGGDGPRRPADPV